MVDAQVSGTCGRKAVEVRVFSWAPTPRPTLRRSHTANPSPCRRPARRPRSRARGRDRHRDHGAQPPARPAVPGAAFRRRRQLPYRPISPRRPLRGAQSDARCSPTRRGSRSSISPASTWPRSATALGRDRAARLLHQDRLPDRPHLHRPPRPQGSDEGPPGHRYFESSNNPPTGARPTSRPSSSPMPRPTSSISMRSSAGSTRCWPARDGRSWPRPVSTSCRPARSSISPGGRMSTFSSTRPIGWWFDSRNGREASVAIEPLDQ